MDRKLIAWARAVKARRHEASPTLWFFTDSRRTPDPCSVIARLPRHLSGVVFRSDDAPERAALAARIARLCRERRIALVIAADPRLAARLRAGLHLRHRESRPLVRCRGLLTAAAHNRIEVVRAIRNGAHLVFLSPAFATDSHPGARALGALRWNALARGVGVPVVALGGITGRDIRRLGADAAGAIGALI